MKMRRASESSGGSRSASTVCVRSDRVRSLGTSVGCGCGITSAADDQHLRIVQFEAELKASHAWNIDVWPLTVPEMPLKSAFLQASRESAELVDAQSQKPVTIRSWGSIPPFRSTIQKLLLPRLFPPLLLHEDHVHPPLPPRAGGGFVPSGRSLTTPRSRLCRR